MIKPQEKKQLQIEVVTSLESLNSILSKWAKLLAQSQVNRAFGSLHWYLQSLKAQPTLKPYLIIAKEKNELIGILPLALNPETRLLIFPHLFCDYNDMIVKTGDRHTTILLLGKALEKAPMIKGIFFELIRKDAYMARAAQDFSLYLTQIRPCLNIQLKGEYENFLDTKSQSFREKIRQACRKANKAGFTLTQLNAHYDHANKLPDLLLKLNENRFGDTSCFKKPGMEAFITALLPTLLIENRIIVSTFVEKKEVAALNIFVLGAKSLGIWNGGFTTKAAPFSLGRLLVLEGVRQSYAKKFEEFDFMRGQEDYKTRWANSSHSIGTIAHSF